MPALKMPPTTSHEESVLNSSATSAIQKGRTAFIFLFFHRMQKFCRNIFSCLWQRVWHTYLIFHFNTKGATNMLVKVFGSAVYGVEAITITVEVNWMATGKDCLIVGLPDNAVKESMQRVESAIKTNGYTMPRTRIVVNLAPADIKKSGTAFDLPIAIGVLAASEQMKNTAALNNYVMMGELSLDGTLRPIKGALPIAIQARKEGFKGLFVPAANAREAGMVNNLAVYGVNHVKDVIQFFESGEKSLQPVQIDTREEFLGPIRFRNRLYR